MNLFDLILMLFTFQIPPKMKLRQSDQAADTSSFPTGPNIFKMLDDELGTWNETSSDPKMYFLWVTTSTGYVLPVIFTQEQWKMIHEVATMSQTSVENVILDVTKERYSL